MGTGRVPGRDDVFALRAHGNARMQHIHGYQLPQYSFFPLRFSFRIGCPDIHCSERVFSPLGSAMPVASGAGGKV